MKDKILNTACRMFLKFGFKSVTMDDIATEIGVSKKTIYKYFENKHALVDESTSQVHQSCLNAVSQITAQGFSAIKENWEINKMFKDMFKNLGESPLFQLKKYYPDIFEKVMKVEVMTFSECIKENIVKGIKNGVYRDDINIEVYIDFYMSIILGIYGKDISQEETMFLERESLIYHIRAIATEKGIKELEEQLLKYK